MHEITALTGVYADALVRDEAGNLMFMSCFGRDTAIKELMARIQLDTSDQGLRELTLVGQQEDRRVMMTAQIRNAKELAKHTGRVGKTLYGELTHAWIYDPVIQSPDKASGRAWIIHLHRSGGVLADSHDREQIRGRIWESIKALASVPLMEHWREPVIGAITQDMVYTMGLHVPSDYSPRLSKPLGALSAVRVQLSEDFPERVSQMIRAGHLKETPELLIEHDQSDSALLEQLAA